MNYKDSLRFSLLSRFRLNCYYCIEN